MNRSTILPLLLVLACAVPLAALAQTDAVLPQAPASAANAQASSDGDQAFRQSAEAERRRIAGERAAADARYQRDRRDCWQRFAVNACLDRALADRRAVLDVLRRDELALNAQERERRTAARLDEIARKQAASAKRKGDSPGADAPVSPASNAQ